jgi:RND superfamily putative drug exporter
MATLLSRLGRFSARRPWLVIFGWIAALAVAGGAYLLGGGSLASGFSIPGTETSRINDQLADELPDLGGATGTVVFQTSDGSPFDADQRDDISGLLSDIGRIGGVEQIIDPFATAAERAEQSQTMSDGVAQLDVARDRLEQGQQRLDAAVAQAQAAGAYEQASAQFAAQQQKLDEGAAQLKTQSAQLADAQVLLDAADAIRTVSPDGSTAAGAVIFEEGQFDLPPAVKAQVAERLDSAFIPGVSIDYSSEIAASVSGLIGPGEVVGLLIAAIVLIIMLGSLLPAALPLLSSIVGVGVGVAGSLAFAGVVDMSSVTPVLGVMLGLAVGIDYSLFIINRHRRQLMLGMKVHESIGLANGTSGSAVLFAGSTVLIALLALNVTGIPFLGVMGTVGAVCVLIAVLIAVTLTPALLGLIGERVLSRRARARMGHPDHAEKPIRPMRTWKAVVALVLGVAALLVIAIPGLSMRLGLPDGSSDAEDSTQYAAYSIVAEEFGAGQNASLLVVASPSSVLPADGVTSFEAYLASRLMQVPDVVAVAPVGVSADRDLVAFQVVPSDGPSSVSTEALVGELRSLDVPGVDLGVAGQASGNIDISAKLAAALPLYLAVVIGLSLIIMVIVFRSLLVPLIATGGFLLSLAAAFGAVVAVYQWGWLGEVFGVHDPGPVLNFAPLILVGVLFGLAMDYQLFLVSGMREAWAHGLPARSAVVAGLRHGRPVVTAAAIIMISVFGGFVFSHLAMVRPLGFGMAIGVLFDAFVVRMLIIPAVMHLAGEAAWWLPKWLHRVLPHVDVEGSALQRPHSGATAPVGSRVAG